MSTTRGSFYAAPYDGVWPGPADGQDGLALYVGQANRSDIYGQRPHGINVRHGRLQHFGPSDDTGNAFFPWSAFRAFDAAEVQAGRTSLLATAGGRPVFFIQSLQPDAHGTPTTPAASWYQAVRCADPRFLAWWAEHYARPILHAGPADWVGVDNGTFRYSAYCVLGADGRVASSPRWDAPGPQSEAAYLDMIAAAFAALAARYPDIKTLVNRGSMDSWDRYPAVYAGATGTIGEQLSYPYRATSRGYLGELLYRLMVADLWAAGAGKYLVLRWPDLPAATDPALAGEMRRAYVHYTLLAGPNTFFNPVHGGVELPPATWRALAAALGDPLGPASIATLGPTLGYCLYARQTTGGVVYLNWTGQARAVALPGDRLYVDRSGRLVTSLTIPDMAGDYVLALPPGTYTDERRILRADGPLAATSDSPLEVAP